MAPTTEAARPLAGVTVLVLRARHQAGGLAERLEDLGASVVLAPVLEIAAGNVAGLRRAVRGLAEGEHQAICFTSGNAVRAVATALADEGLDGRAFANVLVGCVGPATRARVEQELGLRADVVPDHATAASLGDVFPAGTGTVLLPRGDLAGPELPTALARKGWAIDEVLAYRTRTATRLPREVLTALADGTIDFVAFTSASTADGFHRLLAGRPSHAATVSIGPLTTAACERLGISVAAEARHHDLDGVVSAIVDRVRPRARRARRRSGGPWPSEASLARLAASDALLVDRPLPVRHAISFALGVGVLGAAVATLRPWEWDEERQGG